MKRIVVFLLCYFIGSLMILAQSLTLVELNCENLFDCRHDSQKQDNEFLPEGKRHWTRGKYWNKLNLLGKTILSCSDDLPDLVALCEVENDSVLLNLTRRGLLRNVGYEYLMTESSDVRGLDVALLYQPARFQPICYDYISVPVIKGMRPTRDILYIKGEAINGDTLHVFVLHAPSRYGSESHTRPYRMQVAGAIGRVLDDIGTKDTKIMIVGDFNDYADSPSLKYLENRGLVNITKHAKGTHEAKANYKHEGLWRNLDHVLVSPSLSMKKDTVYINDLPFLLEEDKKYGGVKPKRSFAGQRYVQGCSDHLPLVVRFLLNSD